MEKHFQPVHLTAATASAVSATASATAATVVTASPLPFVTVTNALTAGRRSPRISAFSSAAASTLAASMAFSRTSMRISNFFSPGRSLASSLILGTIRNAVLMMEVTDFQLVLAVPAMLVTRLVTISDDISKG